MVLTLGGLLRERNFRRYWIGETVAQFAQQTTQLAVRLTAVIAFGASAGKLGLVTAASFAPYLVFTLAAGKLADVADRRRVMLVSNAVRAVIFVALPGMSALGVLRLEHLIALSFVAATMAVVFDVSSQSFSPALVGPETASRGQHEALRERLGRTDRRPRSRRPADPAHRRTHGTALERDRVHGSEWTLMRVRVRPGAREPLAHPTGASRIAAGLRFILRHELLRSCVLRGPLYNLCWMAMQTIFVVYAADHRASRPA